MALAASSSRAVGVVPLWRDAWIWGAIGIALVIRLYVAIAAVYLPDEIEVSIPLAESISLAPGTMNLPIRGVDHPALPSYVVHLSGLVFGPTPLGYRTVHIALGLVTILILSAVARAWAGAVASRWTAVLLAFNEYHIGISAYATAKGPHLLLVALAVWAIARRLTGGGDRWLVVAAISTALAFYCKEHALLLVPVFAGTLVAAGTWRTIQPRAVVLAGVVFGLLLLPDVWWHLAATRGPDQASLGNHLNRVGGLGLTGNYLMFFCRDFIQTGSELLRGARIEDTVSENPSMNGLAGLLLLGAMVVTTARRAGDALRVLWLAMFWGVLGFFMLIAPGESPTAGDQAAWYWVDVTLFPATIAAGRILADPRRGGRLWWGLAAAAIMYACLNLPGLPLRVPIPD